MREIKFRAWNKNQKCFGNEATIKELLKFAHDDPEARTELPLLEFCQYTGLKDKNGEEIYEGDIVRLYDGKLCIISYADKWAKYMLAVPPDGESCYKYLETYPDNETYSMNIEVIGNIYENKELLDMKQGVN